MTAPKKLYTMPFSSENQWFSGIVALTDRPYTRQELDGSPQGGLIRATRSRSTTFRKARLTPTGSSPWPPDRTVFFVDKDCVSEWSGREVVIEGSETPR
jgi:hypothetical protein